jgi:hypothetical protein
MPNERKAPEGIPQGLTVRAATFYKPTTLRDNDRSVEFTLATETPARVWSWEHEDVITEVLIADGVRLPSNNQVPLQDSHNRATIKSTLGSVREIRVDGDEVIGRLYFAKSPEALDAFEKIRDGHIDSGSVGYSAAGTWVPRGKTFEHKGKTYEGPMQVTTQWALGEYSLTAIGADPYSKARSEAEEVAEVVTIEEGNNSQTAAEQVIDETKKENVMEDVNKNEQPTVDTEAIRKAAMEAERARVSAITALCTKHNLVDMVGEFVNSDVTVQRAQEAVLNKIAERQPAAIATASRVEMGATDTEKFRAAAVDGLLMRAGIAVANPAAGAMDLSKMGFKALARECLRRQGRNDVYTLSDTEALELAIRSGMMGTSDFAHILQQTGNKSISKGFENARQTWRLWATKGSLPNLEAAKRVNLDDAPEMLEVGDGEEITHGTIGDKGEAIQLATLARKIRISRRALLADDLNLFSRLFAKFGARAGLLIDAVAYGVLNSNPTMADGSALFADTAARGNNLATTNAIVSGASVDIGYQRMMAQKASGGSVLGVIPRYLLVGPKNRVNAHILTASMQDTTANSNANGNTNAFSDLIAIPTPHITTSWYLAADPSTADTVEVAFLDGKETPTIYTVANDGDILGQTFVAYFDVGAAAIGFQGLFKNTGA